MRTILLKLKYSEWWVKLCCVLGISLFCFGWYCLYIYLGFEEEQRIFNQYFGDSYDRLILNQYIDDPLFFTTTQVTYWDKLRYQWELHHTRVVGLKIYDTTDLETTLKHARRFKSFEELHLILNGWGRDHPSVLEPLRKVKEFKTLTIQVGSHQFTGELNLLKAYPQLESFRIYAPAMSNEEWETIFQLPRLKQVLINQSQISQNPHLRKLLRSFKGEVRNFLDRSRVLEPKDLLP